jgi:hypothetical protein
MGQADREESPKVAVLSETAARRIFDGADPMGRYISFAQDFEAHESAQVVGVAHDVRLESAKEDPVAAFREE